MMSLVVTAALAAAPDPGLLKKLAEHDTRMEAWLDTHVVSLTTVGRELDSDGKVKHRTVAVVEQRRKDGHLQTTVIKSTRDDADDRAEEEKRAAKVDAQNKRTESPFASRNQSKYAFTVLGPAPTEFSLLRIGFGPVADPAPEVLTGEAVVDPELGELVHLSFRPSKNPTFVDELQMQLEYRARTGAGRMVSRFTFTGTGGLLMFKKRGDADVAFTYPEGEKQP